MKHDQIHISIIIVYTIYICNYTEHFNFPFFNQTRLCTSQSCSSLLAKGAFAGLTRAWVVKLTSDSLGNVAHFGTTWTILDTRPALLWTSGIHSNGCLFDCYIHTSQEVSSNHPRHHCIGRVDNRCTSPRGSWLDCNFTRIC